MMMSLKAWCCPDLLFQTEGKQYEARHSQLLCGIGGQVVANSCGPHQSLLLELTIGIYLRKGFGLLLVSLSTRWGQR